MGVSVGLLGKHPAFGDFVSVGFELSLKTRLMEWLDRELSRTREAARQNWEPLYDSALPLRFWIGPELLGLPMAGILVFSRDKVNRRYPLILSIMNSALSPPVLDDDQGVYDGLEAYLAEAEPDRGGGAQSLLEGLSLDLPAVSPVGPMLWAHNPYGDLQDMLASVAEPDLTLSAADRSYWWSIARGGKAATFLSHRGLPPADALGWLMGGMPAAPEEEEAPSQPQKISFEATGRPVSEAVPDIAEEVTIPPQELPQGDNELPELAMPEPDPGDDESAPAQGG